MTQSLKLMAHQPTTTSVQQCANLANTSDVLACCKRKLQASMHSQPDQESKTPPNTPWTAQWQPGTRSTPVPGFTGKHGSCHKHRLSQLNSSLAYIPARSKPLITSRAA